MKISKKSKLVLSLALLMLLITSGIGGKYLMDKRTEHERQVAFLKEHEAEIIKDAYIIDEEMTVKDIQVHWDTVKVEMKGTIISKPYGLSVKVSSKNKDTGEVYNDKLIIETNIKKLDSYKFLGFDVNYLNSIVN